MKYFFIGIKGSGMSALAQILNDLGYEVEGSDRKEHFFTEDPLVERGIKIYEFNENNIKNDMVIVKGNAFNDYHEEVKKANELNLKIYTYQEMLGKLTKMFKTVTIAGCHGKTTTTSMLSHVLKNITGCNYLIGDGTGFANKNNEYFILEACEYKRHFLNYTPYYAIITNIDLDHTDYYKDIDDVVSAYQEYAKLAEKMVIACGDDPYTHMLEVNVPIFYYGLNEDNDILAKNVEFNSNGTKFEVFIEDNYYGTFDLPIFGKHMLLDALAVISVCYYERIDAKELQRVLKTNSGAKRRYTETIVNDNVVVDDYAHHPAEIRATIKATKQKYPDKKIVAVFQPHTYTRTQEFSDEIAKVLNTVDYSYIMPIHGARENQEDYPNVTNKLIIDKLDNGEEILINESDKLLAYENTVILFMSPNDISKLENDYIKKKTKN